MLSLSWARGTGDAGVANTAPDQIARMARCEYGYPTRKPPTRTIEYVSELPNLKVLTLTVPPISPMSGRGVQYLSRLQKLEELSISGKGITTGAWPSSPGCPGCAY